MNDGSRLSVLVVDDEEWARVSLSTLLGDEGYAVDTAGGGRDANEKLRACSYDLLIVDLMLKDSSGLQVVKDARSLPNDPEALVVTAYATVETAVEAIKLGAFDYLTKPLDSQRVLLTVRQALERHRLKSEVTRLKREMRAARVPTRVVFAGEPMKRIVDLVAVVARTDSTVLIDGESGTGKDLIARVIHEASPRADAPFLAVNCAALPETLLESELFGHVRGAFTGAVKDKKGLFAEADGGTILLDEVGELPAPIQAKLLRVLQDGELRPVGSNAAGRVDVRVIAATNRDLRTMVADNAFREDLFYRLNVIPVTLPPLRRRKEDIVSLVDHFLARLRSRNSVGLRGFRPEALRMLIEYDWPGNVRELANVVERAVALSGSEWVGKEDLQMCFELDRGSPAPFSAAAADTRWLADSRKSTEKEQILIALEANRWNMTNAARSLGISRTSLWRKVRQFGLRA